MPPRHAIAIDLGRRRLRALCGQVSAGTLRVQRQLAETIPAHVERDDPEALGRWVGFQLRQAGIPEGRATIALAREHVSVKRLTLPTIDRDELPDMARLALRRELTFDPDTAVIDFVPIGTTDTTTEVIAVAAPEGALEHHRRVAKAAGLGVERISLRSKGTTTLISSAGRDRDDIVLTIDVTGDDVEFCVVVDGSVIFSRAAELPAEERPEALADVVITETRRTWMSYRIAQDSREVSSAVLVGPRAVTDRMIDAVHKMLNVPATALHEHALVRQGRDDLGVVWPLAGLLLEPALGVEMIDFAHPRRAPDRAAHRRQRVLAAGLLLVIVAGAAWTVGKVKLGRLEAELTDVRQERARLGPRYQRAVRDDYRLEHLRTWASVDVEWLDHAGFLLRLTPPPDRLVLDAWTGSLGYRGVQYDRRAREPQRWSAPHEVTIILDGEAADRATADAFREALVEGDIYVTSSTGTDARGGRRLPWGFTYRLRTTEDEPMDAAPADEAPPDEDAAPAGEAPASDAECPARAAGRVVIGGRGGAVVMLPVKMIAAGAAGLLLVGWAGRAVHHAFYGGPRDALVSDIDDARADIDQFSRGIDRRPTLQRELAGYVDRTLGGDRETVDHRLRTRLNRIAEELALRGTSVGTGRVTSRSTPARSVFRRQRELRDEIDFVELNASITGEGSIEQALRLVHRIEAEPWLKRLDQVKLDPRDNGGRIAVTVRLTTVYVPGREPVAPAAVAYDPASFDPYVALAQVNPFRLPPAPDPAAAQAAATAQAAAPARFPYEQWKITGVAEGPGGWEVWLRNQATGETRRLGMGQRLSELVFVAGGDDTAIFEQGEHRFAIALGGRLDDRTRIDR